MLLRFKKYLRTAWRESRAEALRAQMVELANKRDELRAQILAAKAELAQLESGQPAAGGHKIRPAGFKAGPLCAAIVAGLLVALVPQVTRAVDLTAPQLETLKAAILSEPSLADEVAAGANGDIAVFFNLPSNPEFIVWRTNITREECSTDGFDWAQVDNLTVGQARIWDWLFADGSANPSEPGVRAGIAEAWKGTAAKLAVQAFVLGKAKRTATRFERLYATGTGTTATPGLLVVEGTLPLEQVAEALSLP